MKKIVVGICALLLLIAVIVLFLNKPQKEIQTSTKETAEKSSVLSNPLSIESMRSKTYPGSDIIIEKALPDGSDFHQYLTSYKSDGLKIYALLTIPFGEKPKNGWPVIIFNHGYIAPSTYQTFPSVGQYASYYPVFAKEGYIVFKPDYRGNGDSEGQPEGAYYSPAYATDVLNALFSIKQFKDANPQKIGMWGHSMGGNITVRDIVVDTTDVKAAVIWGGVVGSYTELLHWRDPKYRPSPTEMALRNRYRARLVEQFGTPETNPTFWNAIDPTSFLSGVMTPVQLHAGLDDEVVPATFSAGLYQRLIKAGKTAEFYEYPGADHNISQAFSLAMERSLAFFNKYLK